AHARRSLARVVLRNIQTLAESPAKRRYELVGRDGIAAATKTVADTADTVFGWSQEGVTGIVTAGAIPEPDAPRPTPTALPEPTAQGTLSPGQTGQTPGEAPFGGGDVNECPPREIPDSCQVTAVV